MCLYYDSGQTAKLNLLKQRKVTVYKLYFRSGTEGQEILNAPYQRTIPVISKNGHIYANRRTTKLTKYENRDQSVYRGIHVYFKYPASVENYPNAIIIEATANLDDLIGTDSTKYQAAFTKITLSKKDTIKYHLNAKK